MLEPVDRLAVELVGRWVEGPVGRLAVELVGMTPEPGKLVPQRMLAVLGKLVM